MGSYTEILENKAFDWGYFDNNASPEELSEKIVDFLNKIENFRSFGDGLKHIMSEKYPKEKEKIQNNPVAFIKECCRINGVLETDICDSTNTLVNWFKPRVENSGVREGGPKGGDTNRKKLFALSFALNLSTEETINLFHNVYFDRAFNIKNTDEMIYYYCKNNNKSWNDAKRLIERTNLTSYEQPNSDSHTVLTKFIKKEIDKTENEEQLIQYISEHARDLNKKNATARRTLQTQKDLALKTAQKEIKANKDKGYGKHKNSMAFLYQTILELENPKLWKSEKKSKKAGEDVFLRGSKTFFGKNARIRDSIKSNFPEVSKLNKTNLNYEELRKLIILLYSYHTWYDNAVDRNVEYTDLIAYQEELNEILHESGLPELYYGNPYDWLFLFCASFEGSYEYSQLDQFRDIIATILYETI